MVDIKELRTATRGAAEKAIKDNGKAVSREYLDGYGRPLLELVAYGGRKIVSFHGNECGYRVTDIVDM